MTDDNGRDERTALVVDGVVTSSALAFEAVLVTVDHIPVPFATASALAILAAYYRRRL